MSRYFKTILIAVPLMIIANAILCVPAYTGEVDILVQKLVDKGVLTPGEAQQIITETKEEVKLQLAKGESPSAPSWTQKVKLKGDLRTRYQWQRKEGKSPSTKTDYRNRDRIRFRLGMEAKVNDKVKVGAGLATGSTSDPRSTNQTLQDDFNKVNLNLDYAYAEYAPYHWVSATAGIMKNYYLWMPDDLLWDSDVCPYGAAAKFSFDPYSNIELFTNTFYGLLAKSGSNQNYPFMYAFQPGFKWRVITNSPQKVTLTAVGTYYGFEGLGDVLVNGGFSGGGNSNTPATEAIDGRRIGGYEYNYNSFGASGELGVENPFGDIDLPHIEIPYLGIFGDYIYNPDPPSNNMGWLIGAKLGGRKVDKKGQWQLAYNYRRLEKDAWVDFLSDSDFYSGDTDAKGSELVFQYAFLDNVIFGFDWYHTQPITNLTTSKSQKEDLVQLDLVFKF